MTQQNNQEIRASSCSLWTLLNGNQISMPSYQRDYVQGRISTTKKKDSVELIRKEFVADLIKGISKDKKTELHFIFGGRDKNRDETEDFVPVDGQQRLTALFLLHWYIFLKSGATEDERETLGKFLYKSRKTSERFCGHLVSLLEDDAAAQINCCADIEDCSWFTGNLSSDPTVCSMLVVLKEFEAQFKEKGIDNWDELKQRLISNDCPITFLRLDMKEALGSGNEIRDLYIKMNDRGKQLTDFENFKAYLHKRTANDTDDFDLLGTYLAHIGKPDTEEERVNLLGVINNDYTDFFFRTINSGKVQDHSCSEAPAPKDETNFDTAMMNYFNEMIRMAFFKVVSKDVSAEVYRNDGATVAEMGGKAFYRFIASSADEFVKKYNTVITAQDARDTMLSGLCDAFFLLNELIKNNVKATTDGYFKTYSIHQLILDTAKTKTNPQLAATSAMFAFINKFGWRDETDDLYKAWYGIVWRCITFTNFEHFSDACDFSLAFEEIIENMQGDSVEALLEAVANMEGGSTLFKHHFKEERIKAKLILEDEDVWLPLINDAVEWNQRGEIYYLLQLASDNYDAKTDCTYDADKFREYLELFKEVFPRGAATKINYFAVGGGTDANMDLRRKFENALLLSEAPTADLPYCHLIKADHGSLMHFLYNNYYPVIKTLASADSSAVREQRKIFLNFMKKLKSRTEPTLEEKLDAILDGCAVNDWRQCFLDADLYSLAFADKDSAVDAAVHISSDGYYFLYQNGKQKNATSAELHTAVLFCRLIDAGKSPELKTENKDIHWDKTEEGKPYRYLICDGTIVYYWEDAFRICGDPANTAYDLDDIVNKLK